MEYIQQAVELAREAHPQRRRRGDDLIGPRPIHDPKPTAPVEEAAVLRRIDLDSDALIGQRIIAHDGGDLRARSFDLLRTKILRVMDSNGWQVLGVTSPTAGCGKTLTAINLALSIARLHERPILLLDADLRKPQVGPRLGFSFEEHLLSVTGGKAQLSDALVQANIFDYQMMVLPTKRIVSGAAEWLASKAMATLLRQIKETYKSCLIIVDLPPMLGSDDVMAVLPLIDNFLLIAASGTTTTVEIEECSRQLRSVETQIVLNKSKDAVATDYGY